MSKFDKITLSRRSMLATGGALLASSHLPGYAETEKTVNILFDSWSTQVLYYKKPNDLPKSFQKDFPGKEPNRLKRLFNEIETRRWNTQFTGFPITPSQLKDMNVYVSLTRYPEPSLAYQPSELDAIQSWVKKGGNVLLMTNHGAYAGNSMNWILNDKHLADRFGVTLLDNFVGLPDENLQLLDPKCQDHERVLSMSVRYARYSLGVQSVWAHDSCNIEQAEPAANIAVPVMEFPSSAIQKGTEKKPVSPYFGLEVSYEKGTLLVLGNSGWVANEHGCQPSPGLIHQADNLQFVMNCLAILGGVQPKPVEL